MIRFFCCPKGSDQAFQELKNQQLFHKTNRGPSGKKAAADRLLHEALTSVYENDVSGKVSDSAFRNEDCPKHPDV